VLFKCAFKLRIQHVKQLGIPGKESPIEIGRVQDERIPSRSELDRAFKPGFVEAGRLGAAPQLDPFRRHKMSCTAATKFNERDKGGVCQQGRGFFLRVQPHRLAHCDLQFLGRTQLLEASKAGEGVSVVAGVPGRHSRRWPIANVDLSGDFQARGRIGGELAYGTPECEELSRRDEVLPAVVKQSAATELGSARLPA
jgi:hypothetical protein